MQIQLPPSTEALARDRASAAGFDSVEQYIQDLVLHDDASAALQQKLSEQELASSIAMLKEGIEEMKAGKTVPAKEAIREIAAKHGLKFDR